ncbi:MAG: SurA N-terminal domain-containing protein [Helicobacteraceae bacterium]|nr:SurA N-terminal domain-containing protein [Helicobacteraceae bacterium]
MRLFIIFISLALEMIIANTIDVRRAKQIRHQSLALEMTTANTIDGIAIKVNGNIITMHEIQALQEKTKISKKEAIEQIIKDKLRENEIKRLGINIDDAKLDEEINNIASANNITRDELKNTLKSQGIDFDKYKDELKEHLLNRGLMQKILQTNINLANDEALKKYYNSNQELFTFPTLIKVTSYTSINDVALQKFLSNPLITNPEVQAKEEEIDIRNLPPQIVNIF